MALKRCMDCPALTNKARCPACTSKANIARGSSTQRGYDEDWERVRLLVLRRDRYVCRIRTHCDGATASTVDHVIPLSKGGARLAMSNLVAACRSCNYAKGARPSTQGASRGER